MSPNTSTVPQPLLNELHQSLIHVLSVLRRTWEEASLSHETESGQQSFRFDAPDGRSVSGSILVAPSTDTGYKVKIALQHGPSRQFSCTSNPTTMKQLSCKMRIFLLNEVKHRLETPFLQQASTTAPSPQGPQVTLDRDGAIKKLNEAARRVLEYAPDESIEPNFFSHIDGENLRRVMRDLAQMVTDSIQAAQWLLRLRTGTHRWRWYRAAVQNKLPSNGEIRIHLHPLKEKKRPL